MLIIISILLACILILVGVLLAMSPGKPKPIVDENGKPLAGSISEKIFVTINGVEQGMFIRSKDPANPVLLFVHGGPPVHDAQPEEIKSELPASGEEATQVECRP